MPRVTSRKTRQMMFVVGEPFEPGFTPEQLALYLSDGTPMDLTKDGTRMHWSGEWDPDLAYEMNDLVVDEGDLYILVTEAVSAGGLSPSLENAPEDDTVIAPGDAAAAGAGSTAYRVIDGEREVDTSPSGVLFFFDLVLGGTVTIVDLSPDGSEYLKLYDDVGDQIAVNYPPTFGVPLVATELPAGRYYIYDQEAVDPTPSPAHVQVTLSDGASFYALTAWKVLLRGVHLEVIEADLEAIGISLVAIDDRLDVLEASPDPEVLHWEGVWDDAILYAPLAIVRHTDALWIAEGGAAVGSEPGAIPETTVASPGGASASGDYTRIGVGSTPDVPYDAVGTRVFFDLAVGGTVSINSTIDSQYNHLYDGSGTEIAHSAGLGPPVTMAGLAAGRYYVVCQPGMGGSGTTTVTLTLSAGASAPGESPWEIMLQGV